MVAILNQTLSVKYLGVTLDQSLSFSDMATSILKKANAKLKFLYRKQNYLTPDTKKLLIMSLVQCHFDYACSVWYNSLTKVFQNKFQTTQNKMIRFALDLDYNTHIDKQHFKYLGWLPVQKRVEQIIISQVFNINNGSAPKYMNEHIKSQLSVHTYNTRFREKGVFAIPKVKSFGSKSFCFNGCTLWNKLPFSITLNADYPGFKTALKSHLFDNI